MNYFLSEGVNTPSTVQSRRTCLTVNTSVCIRHYTERNI